MQAVLGSPRPPTEGPAPPEDREPKVKRVAQSVEVSGGMADNPLTGGRPGSFLRMANARLDPSGNVVPADGSRFLRVDPEDPTSAVLFVDGNTETRVQTSGPDSSGAVTTTGSKPVDGLFSFEGSLVAVVEGALWLWTGRGPARRIPITGGTALTGRWFAGRDVLGKRFTRATVNNETVVCSGAFEDPIRLHVAGRDEEGNPDVQAHVLGIPRPEMEDVTEGTPVQPVKADPEADPPVAAVVPGLWLYFFAWSRRYSSDGYNKVDFGPPSEALEVVERETGLPGSKTRVRVHSFRAREGTVPPAQLGPLALRMFRTRSREGAAYEVGYASRLTPIPAGADGTFSFDRDPGVPSVVPATAGVRYLRTPQADGFDVKWNYTDSNDRAVSKVFSKPTDERPTRITLTEADSTSLPAVLFIVPDGDLFKVLLAVERATPLPGVVLSLGRAGGPNFRDSELNNALTGHYRLGYRAPVEAPAVSASKAAGLSTAGGKVSLYSWDLGRRARENLLFRVSAYPVVSWSDGSDAEDYNSWDFRSARPIPTFRRVDGVAHNNPVSAVALGKGVDNYKTASLPASQQDVPQMADSIRNSPSSSWDFIRYLEVKKDNATVPSVLIFGSADKGDGFLRPMNGTAAQVVHRSRFSYTNRYSVFVIQGYANNAYTVSLDTPGFRRRSWTHGALSDDVVQSPVNNRRFYYFKDGVFKQASLSFSITPTHPGLLYRDAARNFILDVEEPFTDVASNVEPRITFSRGTQSYTYRLVNIPNANVDSCIRNGGDRWLPTGYTRYAVYDPSRTYRGNRCLETFTLRLDPPRSAVPFYWFDPLTTEQPVSIHIGGLPSNVSMGFTTNDADYSTSYTSNSLAGPAPLETRPHGNVQLISKENLGNLTLTVDGTALGAEDARTDAGFNLTTAVAPVKRTSPVNRDDNRTPWATSWARINGEDAYVYTWRSSLEGLGNPPDNALFTQYLATGTSAQKTESVKKRTIKLTSDENDVTVEWTKDSDVGPPDPWDLRDPSLSMGMQVFEDSTLPAGEVQDDLRLNPDAALGRTEVARLYTQKGGQPNFPPPPSKFCAAAGGRVFLGGVRVGSDVIENRVVWSNTQSTGPAPHGFDEGQFLDLDDPVTAMARTVNNMIVFTKSTVHRIEGVAGGRLGIYGIEDTHGCPSPLGPVDTPTGLVFPAEAGVFVLKGVQPIRLSDHISRRWKEDIPDKSSIVSVHDPVNQLVHFIYRAGREGAVPAADPDFENAFTLDMRRSRLADDGGWFCTREARYYQDARARDMGTCWAFHEGAVHAGEKTGQISRFSSGLQDVERPGGGPLVPVSFLFIGGGMDCGGPGLFKTSSRLSYSLDCHTPGAVRFQLLPDGGRGRLMDAGTLVSPDRIAGGGTSDIFEPVSQVRSRQAPVLGPWRRAVCYQTVMRTGYKEEFRFTFAIRLDPPDFNEQNCILGRDAPFIIQEWLEPGGLPNFRDQSWWQGRFLNVVEVRRPEWEFLCDGSFHWIATAAGDPGEIGNFTAETSPPWDGNWITEVGEDGSCVRNEPMPEYRAALDAGALRSGPWDPMRNPRSFATGTARIASHRSPSFSLVDCTLHAALTGITTEPGLVGGEA